MGNLYKPKMDSELFKLIHGALKSTASGELIFVFAHIFNQVELRKELLRDLKRGFYENLQSVQR